MEDHRAGRLERAEVGYRAILGADASHAACLNLLGVLCHQTGRNLEAIDLLRRAVEVEPGVGAYRCNFGMVLAKLNRLDEAIAELERAVELQPDSADGWGNLANVYKQTGEIDRAIDFGRHASALKKDPRIAGNLLYLMYLHPALGPGQIAAAHRAWNRAFAEPLKRLIRPHGNDRRADRRLKVGFVLPFLADHPVVRFLMPYLENFSGAEFEITCYYDKGDVRGMGDVVIPRLLGLPIQLESFAGCDDDRAAEIVRRDGIDILVDLSMHTEDNRLLMFARKPAPVQMTWLAY